MENKYRIFSNKTRVDQDYDGYYEPIFPFIDRSAKLPEICLRDLIEKWFDHFPIDEQKHLLDRIRTRKDHEFSSAFFELYLHELLFQQGFAITVHPKLSNDTLRTPDFLVSGNNESDFYLEAVTPNELPKDIVDGQSRLNSALDKINAIESERFFINLQIKGNPVASLPTRKMTIEIREWLEAIDYDGLASLYNSKGMNAIPKKIFKYHGVEIEITPIPKFLNKGKREPIIGSQMSGFRLVNTKKAIRKAIKPKSRRYGEMDKPFFIAINVLTPFFSPDIVVDALFGSEQLIFDYSEQITPPIRRRAKDGAWSPNQGTRVTGILITNSLKPWLVSHKDLSLYLNPWATYPYKGRLTELPTASFGADGDINWHNGIHPREILGLSESWPGRNLIEGESFQE